MSFTLQKQVVVMTAEDKVEIVEVVGDMVVSEVWGLVNVVDEIYVVRGVLLVVGDVEYVNIVDVGVGDVVVPDVEVTVIVDEEVIVVE